MSEAVGEPIAHGLWTLADHLDGHHFDDGPRKAIASAARDVIEAVGEHPGCPYCHGDGWVSEGEDKAKPCPDCRQTGLDLPEVVVERFGEREDRIRRLEERVAELVGASECKGQRSLEDAS